MDAHDERDLAFWSANARVGNVLNGVVIVVDGAYFGLTWSTGAHRPLLLAITALAAVGFVGAIAGGGHDRLVRSKHRDLGFQLWAVIGIAFVVFAAALDGGLDSPLLWLFPLGTMFCALVHPRRLVIGQSIGTLTGFLVLVVIDDGFGTRPAASALQAGYIVTVGLLAAWGAEARWAYHRAQVELTDWVAGLAEHDGLTGLYNHRAFHEHLRAELATAAGEVRPVSVVLVDLDRFKEINDEHGHLVGDATLREVAGALAGVTREHDVVARVGGEEFGFVLRGMGTDAAAVFAERVRRAVAAITHPVAITVSAGVASFPTDGVDPETLYASADRALYEAKHAGRNRVCSAA
jgi:diguanylate cyclase (GGDEF)-like protein